MRILTGEETGALLPYGALGDALAEVLRGRKVGSAYAPPRVGVPLTGGGLLFVMPAADERLAITKLVTIHTDNDVSKGGLPVVQADVIVMDAATGRRLLMLDGNVVTARRTAALSLLAARLLAPDPGGSLLVVGGGTQARSHLEAFVEGLGVRMVYVCSRSRESAMGLADYARTLTTDLQARAIDTMEDILSEVSLIVTATTSAIPVLPANAGLRPNVFIAAIGAYTPQMAELPSELVLRSRIFVDTLEGAQSDAGDLIQAGVDWRKVTPIQDVLDTERPTSGPVIFKSVGHALWDLAAGRLAVKRET